MKHLPFIRCSERKAYSAEAKPLHRNKLMDNPSLNSTKTIVIDGREYPVIVCSRGASAHVPQRRESKRDTVGVYLLGSDRPEPYRFDIETARTLRNQGLLDFINRKCDVRLKKPPQLTRSQATIRQSELEANAGLRGRSRTAHLREERRQELMAEGKLKTLEDFIERSETKVGLWPLVGDSKAVRTGPRPDLRAIETMRDLAQAGRGGWG